MSVVLRSCILGGICIVLAIMIQRNPALMMIAGLLGVVYPLMYRYHQQRIEIIELRARVAYFEATYWPTPPVWIARGTQTGCVYHMLSGERIRAPWPED